jgi:hypothetical protein
VRRWTGRCGELEIERERFWCWIRLKRDYFVSGSLQRTQIQTYDDEEPTMQPSIRPLLRRLTGSSAIGCEPQERTWGLSTV